MTLKFYALRTGLNGLPRTGAEVLVEHEDLGEIVRRHRDVYVSRFTWDGQSLEVECYPERDANDIGEQRFEADVKAMLAHGIWIKDFQVVEDRAA